MEIGRGKIYQGGWGKRDSYLDFEDEDSSDEDKRAWSGLRGTWGKRAAADWQSFRGSWGKRDPAWNNLKGLWGKRSVDSRTGIKGLKSQIYVNEKDLFAKNIQVLEAGNS
ncbi:hypothetical protein J6590_013104 [Homalodisca vitripennis]|nr:hypothetical protein J6590_013104 [Homalodisca vitripennis]